MIDQERDLGVTGNSLIKMSGQHAVAIKHDNFQAGIQEREIIENRTANLIMPS